MPSIPSGIATVLLTGRYIRPDGTPLTGTLTFEPPATLTFPDADVIGVGAATAQLDETGAFTVSLIATDAAGGTPSSWTYTVVERLHQANGRTYHIALPSATTVVDLADIAPTDPAGGEYVVVTGPAGKDGSQIYRGTGDPSSSLGVAGDYYVDDTAGDSILYGPRTADGWPSTGILLSGVRTINGQSGDATLTAADVQAVPLDGSASAHGVTDWLNVKRLGAKGDNVTDDLAAIQGAIDTAYAAGGGTVYFPYGAYRISNSIVLKPGVTLKGGHSPFWPFRFPAPLCTIRPTSSFAGEAAISILGKDAPGAASSTVNQGNVRVMDLELDGSAMSGNSVSGIHAQGEALDVALSRVTIKYFTHNGIHTNVGSGTLAPHDWQMDSVVAYNNAGYGFSMSMTDGYIRDCVASSNGLDGWLVGPFGSLVVTGAQALWNNGHGFNIAGGTQVGNLALIGPLTDRNGKDGIHLGASSGSGSPPIVITGAALNRDGKNGGAGGGGYAGLAISGCANPIIVNGLTVNVGVDDTGAGSASPQYGVSLTNSNAYVQLTNGYAHGVTAGIFDDGTTSVLRRFNVDEASGPRDTPTFAYGNGIATSGLGLVLPAAATAPATPTTGAIIYGGTSRGVIKNASGLNGTIPVGALGKTTTTTVSNSTTETVLHTLTIPGSDASAGSVYAIKAMGTLDWTTGSPTATVRIRMGGVSGPVIASTTITCPSTAGTSAPWMVEGDAVCISTGTSGTWRGSVKGLFGFPTQTTGIGTASSAIVQSTSATNDLVVTVQWSAASASNTIRCDTGHAMRNR
ncbi:glycosyl hydrolase family 28-related protein [Streptomyces achromogenes]|uniref:glycosyl hydrolase family 28-related protein n=1 Tax=Streptomyces achromogenes TaxID=67255 RepID=UPI0036FA9499